IHEYGYNAILQHHYAYSDDVFDDIRGIWQANYAYVIAHHINTMQVVQTGGANVTLFAMASDGRALGWNDVGFGQLVRLENTNSVELVRTIEFDVLPLTVTLSAGT